MVPPPRVVDGSSPLHGAIALAKVGGGEESGFFKFSRVGTTELEEALRMSLEQSGFLSAAGAKFTLEAFLVELKQPTGGFTMKVDSLIRYKLVSNPDGAVVFDDILTGSYIGTMEDSFLGGKRMQLASEGAIRANIAGLLARLNSLENVK